MTDVQRSNNSSIKGILSRMDPMLMHVEEYILSYGIIVLALLLVGNVLSRVLFNYSWQFVEEIAQTIVIFVTFLGLGYCVRKARHIRMTAIYDLLGDRTRKVFIIIISAVTGATMLLMAYWSAQYAWNAFQRHNVTPSLRIPMYIIYGWVPLGFLMAAVEYILTIFKNLKEKDVYLSIEQPDVYEDESCLLEVPCEFTPEYLEGKEE